MEKFFTKLASFVTAFALMLTIIPGGLRAEETSPANPAPVAEASLAIKTFVALSNTQYKGILVEVTPKDIVGATDFSITIERGSYPSVVKSLKTQDKIESYINGKSSVVSVPFPIVELTYKEEGSGSWTPMTNNNWSVDTRPTKVIVTALDAEGNVIATAESESFGENAAWESIVPSVVTENFNTHSGTDYKGINVGFRVSNTANLNDVVVSLLDAAGNILVSNTGIANMLTGELKGDGSAQLSTPFITQNLSYTETHWTLGDWTSYAQPKTAVIRVNGIEVRNETLSEQHTWASLVPTVNAENFNTHDGANYRGISVGFNVANISTFSEVTVELQDENGATLAINEGNLAKLNELLAGGTLKFSTPFITENLTYGVEEYWTLGDWRSAAKPAKAIITVNGVVAVNENLSEQHEWTTIAPVIPEPTPTRRSGGSRRSADTSTPTGEVAGAETGPEGEVLGASAYNFTADLTVGSTGDDVTALQTMLIASGDLEILVPTGYFGELTKAALIKWQARNGVPATGYFGPLTRAAVAAAGTPAPTMTDAQRTAMIAELLKKVLELQEKINNL